MDISSLKVWVALKRAFGLLNLETGQKCSSTAEAVERASLALESVDDVHGGHGLSLSMLGVGHSITDDILKKHFQNPTSLLIDQARDTLHAATTSKATDGGFGYALDVISQNFAVALGASLAESFASFSSS